MYDQFNRECFVCLFCFCVDQNIVLPRDDLFFDHSTLKLVIQIYDFVVYYLTSCYVQLSIVFLQFDSNLETEANPLLACDSASELLILKVYEIYI